MLSIQPNLNFLRKADILYSTPLKLNVIIVIRRDGNVNHCFFRLALREDVIGLARIKVISYLLLIFINATIATI